MLGKLFKYEMKATSRLFLPLYGLMLIFTVVGRILFTTMISSELNANIFFTMLFGMTMVAYMVLIFSTMIMTVVIIIRRFYTNLLCQDGYLMHTLPVTTHQLILSKLFSAVIWQILTGTIVFLSVVGIFVTGEMMMVLPEVMYDFNREWQLILSEINGVKFAFDMVLMFVTMFMGSFATTIIYYTSMTLGHTVKRHRIWASFGAYFAITFAVQQITYWMTMILQVNTFSPYDMMYPYDMTSMFTEVYNMYISIFYQSIFMYIVIIVGGYLTTHYILKNKLNLE